MMKNLAVALVLAFASVAAHADLIPLQGGSISPGADTGVYGEQTCPPPVGCVESGTTVLTFNIIPPSGSMGLAFIGVLDPSGTGSYSFDVEVFSPLNVLIASGIGSPTLVIPSFNVFVGNGYHIDVDWTFSGAGTTQTASWGVVAATSASAVPEPGSLALLGAGLLGLIFVRRKRSP